MGLKYFKKRIEDPYSESSNLREGRITHLDRAEKKKNKRDLFFSDSQ